MAINPNLQGCNCACEEDGNVYWVELENYPSTTDDYSIEVPHYILSEIKTAHFTTDTISSVGSMRHALSTDGELVFFYNRTSVQPVYVSHNNTGRTRTKAEKYTVLGRFGAIYENGFTTYQDATTTRTIRFYEYSRSAKTLSLVQTVVINLTLANKTDVKMSRSNPDTVLFMELSDTVNSQTETSGDKIYNIDIDIGLVNGTRGIIKDFINGLPVMEYDNGQVYHVQPYDFKSRIYNETSNNNEVVLHVKQLPLSLSYAITVNRSQGLTFDKVIIDIGNEGLYHKGKIYTAISRCKSARGLLFYNFPNRQKNSQGLNFAIDEDAKKFLDLQDLKCSLS
jgi:hypothetical protein